MTAEPVAPAAAAASPEVKPAAPVAPAPETPTKLFDLYNSLTGSRKPKEKAESKPTPTPAKVEAKVEEQPAAPTEPEKKEKVRTRTRHVLTDEPTPVDTAGIAKAVADGVNEGLKRGAEQAKPKETPKAPELPEMYAHRAAEFETLEKMYPDKYGKGKLVKLLAKSAQKISDYQSTWEEQNPGKDFNPSEHTEEIDGFTPNIDQDDITRAQVRIETDRETKSLREELGSLKGELHAQKLHADIVPKAQAAVSALGQSIIAEVAPELHKLAQSGDRAGMEKYVADNAEMLGVVNEVVTEQLDDAHRAFVLMSPGGDKLVDLKNPTPQDVRILNHLLPAIETHMDGVKDTAGIEFTTWAKYQSLSDAQKSKYRVIDPHVAQSVMKVMAVSKAKARIKAISDQDAAVLKRYGYAVPGAKVEAKVDAQPEVAKNGEAKTEKTTSNASGAVTPGSGPAVRPASSKTDASKNPFGNLFSNLAGIR